MQWTEEHILVRHVYFTAVHFVGLFNICKYFILLLIFLYVDSIILGMFALSQINSYCLPHVRLSVGICQLTSQWTDFCGIWCWGLLLKSVEKIVICLKSGNNIGNFNSYCCRCDNKSPLRRIIQLKSYQYIISSCSSSISLYFHLPMCIRPAPTRRIYVEFCIGDYCENLSRNSTFV